MPTHGKKYRNSLEGIDLTQRFSVEDAVAKSLGASFAKFDETVDVALRLGVDPKYSDQMVRGAVSLPPSANTGRSRAAGWNSTPPWLLLTSWLWSARSAVCSAPAA